MANKLTCRRAILKMAGAAALTVVLVFMAACDAKSPTPDASTMPVSETPYKWQLDWYYFGDVETLVTGSCEYYNLIQELITIKNSQGVNSVTSILLDKGTAWEEPRLITMMRRMIYKEASNAMSPNRSRYVWEKHWPFEELLVRRLEGDDAKEIIVSPTQMVFPWPFPLSDDVPDAMKADFNALVEAIGDDIETVNWEEEHPQDLRARSVLVVAHDLMKEPQGTRNRSRLSDLRSSVRRQALLDYERDGFGRDKFWATFEIPDPANFKIRAYPFVPSNETRLTAESNGQLHLEVGFGSEIELLQEKPYWEPHPCGGFTDDTE